MITPGIWGWSRMKQSLGETVSQCILTERDRILDASELSASTMNRDRNNQLPCWALTVVALVSLCTLLVASSQVPVAASDSPGSASFFESRIRPILAERCYSCHSEKSGLSKGG